MKSTALQQRLSTNQSFWEHLLLENLSVVNFSVYVRLLANWLKGSYYPKMVLVEATTTEKILRGGQKRFTKAGITTALAQRPRKMGYFSRRLEARHGKLIKKINKKEKTRG